jgi:hypothetical protein
MTTKVKRPDPPLFDTTSEPLLGGKYVDGKRVEQLHEDAAPEAPEVTTDA